VLDQKKASPVRQQWIRARLAEATGDESARLEAVRQARTIAPGPDSDPVDRIDQLRITCLEIRSEADLARLSGQVQQLREQVKGLGKPEELAPSRIARLRSLLEQSQRVLIGRAAQLPAERKKAIDGLVDAIEVDLESIFQQALVESRQPDLQTYLT